MGEPLPILIAECSHMAINWNLGRFALVGPGIALALLVGGCGIPDSTLGSFEGNAADRRYRSTLTQGAPTLVGRWSRTIFVTDGTGGTDSHTTSWVFRDDGGFIQTVTIIDLASGRSQTTSRAGRWAVDRDFLVITFGDNPGFPARFPFVLFGSELAFGGTNYTRAG
ncbi:MAG TPA: hypothetical protein VNA89_11445 [Gemmatimonadaceae bacterium]|nr:hypothetical protein [Gemmatimonadaceae bacterium]